LGCAGGDFTECSPLALSIQDQKPRPKIDAPLDGNNITTFISIEMCIIFWSRSCIDNARGEHSVKSPQAHPKNLH